MDHKINTTSIHLGGDNQYYAEYLPIATTQACALPSTQDFVLSNVPLTPLNEACQFTFPGVTPIPPVYVPVVVPPVSCEHFGAFVNIRGLNAAKNTRISGSSAGPPNCGLNISGIVDVLACEGFKTTGKISFTGAAKKGSNLDLQSTSRPDCGISLNGTINVVACESFKSEGTITVTAKDKVRKLVVKPKVPIEVIPQDIPDCGFKLKGELELDACSSFNLEVDDSQLTSATLSFVKKSDGSEIGKFKLDPSITITGDDDCEKTIRFSLGAIDASIAIPDSKTLEVNNSIAIDGRWTLAISDTATGYMLGFGDNGKVDPPCSKETTQNVLNVVHVKNAKGCCNNGAVDNFLDMCAGSLYMGAYSGGNFDWLRYESGLLTIGKPAAQVSIVVPEKNGVPKAAYFQEVSMCVDGEQKTAFVLMTDPE
jgi:hypothetical protein